MLTDLSDALAKVILVDGNGLLHHRLFGSATHLGVLSGYPTIGVAKNLLHVQGLDEHVVRAQVRQRIAQKTENGVYNEESVISMEDH